MILKITCIKYKKIKKKHKLNDRDMISALIMSWANPISFNFKKGC